MSDTIHKTVRLNADLPPKEPAGQAEIPIHFIKSAFFRVVHAMGVWYGGDAQQNLHLTFYNERTPIPKKLVVRLNDQGMVIGEDESQRQSKDGVIREMEVDIILSIQAATEFHRSLGENLKAIQANKNHANH